MAPPRGPRPKPCAACNFRRIRCEPYCFYAPYFPPQDATKFFDFNRFYSVRNIERFVNVELQADERVKDEIMSSFISESQIRASDPIGGCTRLIQQLNARIDELEFELQQYRQQTSSSAAGTSNQQPVLYDYISASGSGGGTKRKNSSEREEQEEGQEGGGDEN